MLVTGPNGVGKTSLLESLHLGSQGFSPRTRKERQAIRFHQPAARVGLHGSTRSSPVETRIILRRDEPKETWLNGVRLATSDTLGEKLAALTFTPDRLVVAKGAPMVRRAYLDRMVGRLTPGSQHLPSEYREALSQRNAALRRIREGLSTRNSIAPWDHQVAANGTSLDEARARLVAEVGPLFVSTAETLGLETPELRYETEPLTVEALEERLETDLRRGTTGIGPHLRDLIVVVGGRDLRAYGSQGEQRLTVLALILAEAEQLTRRRGQPPLLLLDDVFSELDDARMQILVKRLPAKGQVLVTSTHEPSRIAVDLHLTVKPGRVESA